MGVRDFCAMGRPLPGIKSAIVERSEGWRLRLFTQVGKVGELALRQGWPSQFQGYLSDESHYEKCFADGWHLSGDLARCDKVGYYLFVGRADDVIKYAGQLIGPFEGENVLLEHPAVAEAGVSVYPSDPDCPAWRDV
jgi:acetyl-CoA synthetase